MPKSSFRWTKFLCFFSIIFHSCRGLISFDFAHFDKRLFWSFLFLTTYLSFMFFLYSGFRTALSFFFFSFWWLNFFFFPKKRPIKILKGSKDLFYFLDLERIFIFNNWIFFLFWRNFISHFLLIEFVKNTNRAKIFDCSHITEIKSFFHSIFTIGRFPIINFFQIFFDFCFSQKPERTIFSNDSNLDAWGFHFSFFAGRLL